MRTFDYQSPISLSDATAALASEPEARLLAGGMTLIPALKMRLAAPSALVDLGRLNDLRGIKVAGNVVTLGAMTTHAEVAVSSDVRKAIPALAELAGGIGDPQVRNRGTIGGSIANNDPAADYPAALLGLAATVATTKRTIPAGAFFSAMFETALDKGEIVTAINFPVPLAAAYEKFRSPASRYALVGVFIARTTGGVRVAVTGAAPCVFRSTEIESALSAKFTPEAIGGVRISSAGLNSDVHGDADYRAHLIGVLAKRAVERVLGISEKR
jgi:aerobic carbon-monoxide dehydrogenase medium subunit